MQHLLQKVIGYCSGLVHFYWPTSNCSVEVHHRHYIITYTHGFESYKILTPRRRGPCKFNRVTDQDGNDATESIKQFAGPSHNFHGIPTTPKMLGYTRLTFFNGIDDSQKTFEESEVIDI